MKLKNYTERITAILEHIREKAIKFLNKLDMENQLLQKIKDEVAQLHEYDDWAQIDMTEDSECEKDAVKATMIDDVAQRYAEAYHSARIAEVAKGECFERYDVDLNYKTRNYLNAHDDANRLIEYLNNKAAAFAAAKVDELTRWKESALKVLNALDLQELGKELVIGLGEDIASQVLPKVKELKALNDNDLFKIIERAYREYGNEEKLVTIGRRSYTGYEMANEVRDRTMDGVKSVENTVRLCIDLVKRKGLYTKDQLKEAIRLARLRHIEDFQVVNNMSVFEIINQLKAK